ncbi:DUF4192 family protein [Pseudactinotalea sp. HY158]|nr:DUF4192 family protein [Pseudactinotalea sp. HY158]
MIDTDVHTLDLDDPAEVVAYVPYRLGFRPENSLVVLSVRRHGPDRVGLGLVARMDLADLADPRLERTLLSEITGHLSAEHCVAAWLLAYCDPAEAGEPATLERARRVLAPWRRDPRTSAGRCYLVSGARWYCLECTHDPACPPNGRGRGELDSTAIAAAMVVHGHGVAPPAPPSCGCGPTAPRRPPAPRGPARPGSRNSRGSRGRAGAPRGDGAAPGPGTTPSRRGHRNRARHGTASCSPD